MKITTEQALQEIMRLALERYKRKHGLLDLLTLIHLEDNNSFLKKIKPHLPKSAFKEVKAALAHEEKSFRELLKAPLADTLKPKRLISIPRALLISEDEERNRYFGRIFDKPDSKFEALKDIRRDNYLQAHGYPIQPNEPDESCMRKVAACFANPIMAHFIAARSGQALQEGLAKITCTHLNIDYQDISLMPAAQAPYYAYDNQLKSDENGVYFTGRIGVNYYAFFAPDKNLYLAAPGHSVSKINFITEAQKQNIASVLTENQLPEFNPLLQTSYDMKIYIRAYAFKDGASCFAYDKDTDELVLITDAEYAHIKDALIQGEDPARPLMPYDKIPKHIASSTAPDGINFLLGKIEIASTNMFISDWHKDLTITHKIQTAKDEKPSLEDSNYYQQLRAKLAQLKLQKKASQAKTDSALDYEIKLTEKDIFRLEKENYKRLFANVPSTSQSTLALLPNLIAMAELKLASHETTLQAKIHELHELDARLQNSLTEKARLISQKDKRYHQIKHEVFLAKFNLAFSLLKDPSAYLQEKHQRKANDTETLKLLNYTKEKFKHWDSNGLTAIENLTAEKCNSLLRLLTDSMNRIDAHLEKTKIPAKQLWLNKLKQWIALPTGASQQALNRAHIIKYRDELHNLHKTLTALIKGKYGMSTQDFLSVVKNKNEIARTQKSIADTQKELQHLQQKIADDKVKIQALYAKAEAKPAPNKNMFAPGH